MTSGSTVLLFCVPQVSAEVRHRQLLPRLQRHAGLLSYYGHEGQPPVQRPTLQEATGGVPGRCACDGCLTQNSSSSVPVWLVVSLQKKEAERPKVEVVEEEEEVVVHEDNDWGEEELQVNPDYSH